MTNLLFIFNDYNDFMVKANSWDMKYLDSILGKEIHRGLGPWTPEVLLNYFNDDYGDEKNWPFSRKEIEDFVKSDKEYIVKKIK